MKKEKFLKILKVLAIFLLIVIAIYPRAGGGGRSGGSSNSGGSGNIDISMIIYFIWHMIPRSYDSPLVVGFKLSILSFMAYLIYQGIKTPVQNNGTQRNRYKDYSLNKNSLVQKKDIEGQEKFLERNPKFDKEEFMKKVHKSFFAVQNAWEEKDLSKVRKYISDGVYQRFNTQFEMMKVLEQVDKITNLNIISSIIDKFEVDGEYDIVHVGIMADIVDQSSSKKFPELNEYAKERFIEYWSFIRKKGINKHNIYDSDNCPNCGSILPNNMGEVSKCDSCSTIINKGDYDWVLAEISQVSDYLEETTIKANKTLIEGKERLGKSYKNFSIQHIEDKVSNGYIQIHKGIAYEKPEMMRRFVSDKLWPKVSKTQTGYIFSRFYLNNVKVIDYKREDNKDILAVKIKASYKRVRVVNNKLLSLDSFIKSKSEVLILQRESGLESKGDLYSHSCPNCGGPLEDTIDVNCPYCGAVLTSSKYDWVIDNIIPAYEFNNFVQSGIRTNPIGKNGYSINEIILNNMLVIMYSDREINSKELKFAKDTAKKLGFKPSLIDVLFDMAKQNRLSLKFPRNEKEYDKLIKYMKRAMEADGIIKEEEIKVLNEIKETLGIL